MSQVIASFAFSQDDDREKGTQPDLTLLPSTLPSLLLGELLLLQRLREKNAAQHRSAIFFRKLQEVDRIGKRIYEQVLALCDSQAQVTGRGKRDQPPTVGAGAAETIADGSGDDRISRHRETLQALIAKALPVLTRATESVNKMISHLHFLPFTSLLLAIYARLWTLFLDISSFFTPSFKTRQVRPLIDGTVAGVGYDDSGKPEENSIGIQDWRFVSAGSQNEDQARRWVPMNQIIAPIPRQRKSAKRLALSQAQDQSETQKASRPARAGDGKTGGLRMDRDEVPARISTALPIEAESEPHDSAQFPQKASAARRTNASSDRTSATFSDPTPSSTIVIPPKPSTDVQAKLWESKCSPAIRASSPVPSNQPTAELAVKKAKKQKTAQSKRDGAASVKVKKKKSDLDDIFGF